MVKPRGKTRLILTNVILDAIAGGILYLLIREGMDIERPLFYDIPLSLIIFSLVVISIAIITGMVHSHRYRSRDRWKALARPYRPTRVAEPVDISLFGVIWKGVIGAHQSRHKPYCYLDGAYCPDCNFELYEMTTSKRASRKKTYLWKCSNCGFEQERPKQYLFEEKETVEKKVMEGYQEKMDRM